MMAYLVTCFEENKHFNVYWKVKNFSYCWTGITSPEFTFNGIQCWLRIEPNNDYYKISCFDSEREKYADGQISVLTCDGTRELFSDIQGCKSRLTLSVSKEIIFEERRSAFLPKDTLTIRCQIKTKGKSTNIFIHSQIGVKSKGFLWTLKKFSSDFDNKKLSVENSDLYGNIEFNLKSSGGINTHKQFYIEISRRNGERCYSVLKVSVLDNDGKAVNYISDEFTFEKENRHQIWRFPPIVRNSKLLACKNLLLPVGNLSLKCEFAITLGKVTDQTAVYSYYEDIIPLIKDSEDSVMCFGSGGSDSIADLKADLKTLLDNGTLCDVNLKVASDVIPAHMNILSARSPVFKAMFTKDMKETINKTVVIEDIDVDSIRRLLLYMYSDAIHDYQWDNIINLYFVADKYEVLGLKQKCSDFLNANISFSNVCQILVLADLHQDQNLLSSVYAFISKYETEVFASEEWNKLEKQNPPLACQTLREICAKKRLD